MCRQYNTIFLKNQIFYETEHTYNRIVCSNINECNTIYKCFIYFKESDALRIEIKVFYETFFMEVYFISLENLFNFLDKNFLFLSNNNYKDDLSNDYECYKAHRFDNKTIYV